MKKVIVFTSSHISFSLIAFLMETKRLAAVVITAGNNHPQFIEMVGTLQQNKINVYQEPEELKEDFLGFLKSLNIDLAISFSHATIFPEKLILIFKEGIFNIHPSILPKYRGPNPLYWQIRKAETKGGVTIHKVIQKIDSGDIAGSVDFDIEKEDTMGSLANKVVQVVPALMVKFFDDFESNSLKYIKQEKSEYYKRADSEEFRIDWKNDSALEISLKVRSSNPIYGGVEAVLKNNPIRVLEATPVGSQTYGVKEGIIITIDEFEGLVVAAKNNSAIRLDVVSTVDGVFSGYSFANHRKLFSGEQFDIIK